MTAQASQLPAVQTSPRDPSPARDVTVSAAGVPVAQITSDLEVVDRWLSGYIAQPHHELGRTGAVCPFVAPAIAAGSAVIRFDYEVLGEDRDELTALLTEHVREFAASDVPARKRLLRTVLLVLPALTHTGRSNLDSIYPAVKAQAVRQGLMVGQFHEDCDQRAIRNSGFRVSLAPVPLFAIRFMAIHDVLFLGEDRDMFREYRRSFGTHHELGRVRDAALRAAYAAAMVTHAPIADSL